MITFNYGTDYEWSSQLRTIFQQSIKREWLDQMATNNPVVVKDPPIPALPETVKVDRVDAPETERVEVLTEPKIPADVTLTLAPIPTLPLVPMVAAEILLVTDNESKIAAEETVSDWPIPTFPETLMEDPTPKNPER